MALIKKENVAESSIIGIWEITETVEELLSKVSLNAEEHNHYNKFLSDKRKKEWLATRLLLNTIYGKTTIQYTNNGKPILLCNNKISITHSHNMVAILMSDKFDVGIDIEIISNRIEKIKHKFISDKEEANIPLDQSTEYYFLHWCAKETICKLLDNKKLDFKSDIEMQPFSLKQSGTCTVEASEKSLKKLYAINYLFSDNYILTWCLK